MISSCSSRSLAYSWMEKHSAKPASSLHRARTRNTIARNHWNAVQAFCTMAREHSLHSASVDKTLSRCSMYQRRALQGVARALGPQVVVSQVVQFLVDEGNQGVEHPIAPTPPLGQQNGNGLLYPLVYRNIATLWTRSQWH
jgi:hypothetical protein